MQLFYHNKIEDFITLPKEESRHLIKVLRKEINDIIFITDGRGNLFSAKIILQDFKKCQLKILKKESQKKQHNYSLHIAIAPTKNMDRFEWFLEKACEIGIDEITPIICSRSERKIIKTERGNRILLSAMKQSLKYHLPKLNEAISLTNFLKSNVDGAKYIGHCEKSDKLELKNEKLEENMGYHY